MFCMRRHARTHALSGYTHAHEDKHAIGHQLCAPRCAVLDAHARGLVTGACVLIGVRAYVYTHGRVAGQVCHGHTIRPAVAVAKEHRSCLVER